MRDVNSSLNIVTALFYVNEVLLWSILLTSISSFPFMTPLNFPFICITWFKSELYEAKNSELLMISGAKLK